MKKAILSLVVLAAVMLVPRPGHAEAESWRAGPISFKVEGSGADASEWREILDGMYLVQVEKRKRVALLLPAVQSAREAEFFERFDASETERGGEAMEITTEEASEKIQA